MKTHLRQFDSSPWPACPSNRSDGRLCSAVTFTAFMELSEEDKCKRCAKIAQGRLARQKRNQPAD